MTAEQCYATAPTFVLALSKGARRLMDSNSPPLGNVKKCFALDKTKQNTAIRIAHKWLKCCHEMRFESRKCVRMRLWPVIRSPDVLGKLEGKDWGRKAGVKEKEGKEIEGEEKRRGRKWMGSGGPPEQKCWLQPWDLHKTHIFAEVCLSGCFRAISNGILLL